MPHHASGPVAFVTQRPDGLSCPLGSAVSSLPSSSKEGLLRLLEQGKGQGPKRNVWDSGTRTLLRG